MDYYNTNIQLDKEVIEDIFAQFTPTTKMLVFGLGYDSKMWYMGNKHTFFIENNNDYIQLNKDIPRDHVVKYDYKTTCTTSFQLSEDEIQTFSLPEKIKREGPFDIIIIDGPNGYSPKTPGRLIPCFWSTALTKPGSIVYIDDVDRPLEKYCIQKYFAPYTKQNIGKRHTCKIAI